MWEKLVLPPQYRLIVVDAALYRQDIIYLHPIFLLEEGLHLVELRIVHHIHLELYLEFEGVVGVVIEDLGVVVVDLLVSLVEEVVEFLKKE